MASFKQPVKPMTLEAALQLFELTDSFTREQLDDRRRALLATWNPHRFANLTNNPRKYMQSYKKGEAMTKEVGAAYDLLVAWLTTRAID
ncbi:MAG TPA: hypothetical protein VES96_05090 [Nitrospiraceae bacterium]|nr:hypothetical protein [Nitrospiraceae bacterium]